MTGSLHDFIKENVLFTWQVYECAMREQTLQLAVKLHRLTSDVRLCDKTSAFSTNHLKCFVLTHLTINTISSAPFKV